MKKVYVCDGAPCGKGGNPCEFVYYPECDNDPILRKCIPCLYDDIGVVEIVDDQQTQGEQP